MSYAEMARRDIRDPPTEDNIPVVQRGVLFPTDVQVLSQRRYLDYLAYRRRRSRGFWSQSVVGPVERAVHHTGLLPMMVDEHLLLDLRRQQQQNPTAHDPDHHPVDEPPPIYLMRANKPKYAYALIRERERVWNRFGFIAWAYVYKSMKEQGHSDLFLAPNQYNENSVVVIKAIRRNEADSYIARGGHENWQTELRRLQQLQGQPGILPLHDALEADGWVFIVTPYGLTLFDFIRRPDRYGEGNGNHQREEHQQQQQEEEEEENEPEPLDAEVIRNVCQQGGLLLQGLKANGVNHGDIKPENFVLFPRDIASLVSRDPDDCRKVFLYAFDFACSIRMPVDDDGQRTLAWRYGYHGSLPYLAPELSPQCPAVDHGRDSIHLAAHTVGARRAYDGITVDLWAWGIVLYQMALMSERPYEEPSRQDLAFAFLILHQGLLSDDADTAQAELVAAVSDVLSIGGEVAENPFEQWRQQQTSENALLLKRLSEHHGLVSGMLHGNFPPELADLLSWMLRYNPVDRCTLQDFLQSPFITNGVARRRLEYNH